MTEQNNEKKQSNKRLGIVIVLLLILLLVALVVVIGLLLRGEPPREAEDDRPSGGRGTVVTNENVSELLEAGNGVVPDGHYNVSMAIEWHFKNGETNDARVSNKTTNTRTVYFDLLIEGTEELVYSSPFIPVGESLQGFTLDKELAPGTYDMIVRYYLVDDDEKEISNVSVGITAYVE